MVSSFTPNKNLEQPANNDYVDDWNLPINANMAAVDMALGGVTTLATTSSSVALTLAQYQAAIFKITGTLTASVYYVIPAGVGGVWTYDTTGLVLGAFGAFVGCGSVGGGYIGTIVTLQPGDQGEFFCDGTNVKFSAGAPGQTNVTSVNASGGSTGLSFTGGPVTGSGTLTLGGVLNVASGGIGQTYLTPNSVVLGNGSSGVYTVSPGNPGNVLVSSGAGWYSGVGGVSSFNGRTGAVSLATYDVETAMAGANWQDVGTYSWASTGGCPVAGALYPASSLDFVTAGTWRCMAANLFLRVY